MVATQTAWLSFLFLEGGVEEEGRGFQGRSLHPTEMVRQSGVTDRTAL